MPYNRRVPLLNAQTVDETTSIAVDCRAMAYITIYVIGDGTTSSGVITIEEADFNPDTTNTYAGTWSSIQTVNASDVSGSGVQKAIHLTASAYSQIRTRISTVIGGGGNISTVLVGVE